METKIPATRLARGLGDILGRIRYRGESFLVQRNGELVARIGPVRTSARPRLSEVVRVWSSVAADPGFALDLETIGKTDIPVDNPWA
jgi:antitoxin (DNA-binding transcriptional repressor) of toxin-antitoxin stability system